MKYTIFEQDEHKSKFGVPHEKARLWFWEELYTATGGLTGSRGCLRASTEMEALDRLREAFPYIGRIRWIDKSDYR